MRNYDKLPEHIRDGMKLYVENGIEPGSFCQAVLCNDLKGAFSRADHINKHHLPEIVEWLMWECPASAQGSEEQYEAWIKSGGLKTL